MTGAAGPAAYVLIPFIPALTAQERAQLARLDYDRERARVDDEYDYTASRYNLNHGAVLWTLGEHYLHTRDRAWLSVRLPEGKRVACVEIDGKPWKATDAAGRIRLPKTGAPLRLVISLAR
ncbi:MAG: hypothetical protein AAB225_10115 [Acidobacteriota bacterium]